MNKLEKHAEVLFKFPIRDLFNSPVYGKLTGNTTGHVMTVYQQLSVSHQTH